jgi:hypothetical protein
VDTLVFFALPGRGYVGEMEVAQPCILLRLAVTSSLSPKNYTEYLINTGHTLYIESRLSPGMRLICDLSHHYHSQFPVRTHDADLQRDKLVDLVFSST